MAKENEKVERKPSTENANSDLFGTNSEIARKLKQYYEDIVSDEVPDRFAELLAQLEKTDASSTRE